MAENIPNIPIGAVPPKKETGKVQPKKETVRINLPPKPSAAPTIKLPTLPPGGPTGGAAAPAPVLSTALYQRFSSRGNSDVADKLLSAMRSQFGGHAEKNAGK